MLLEILLGAGLVVGAVVAALVDLDCGRRALPARSRLAWTLGCGGGSVAGFLVPYVFYQELTSLYVRVLKPRPITVHSREWLAVALTTGLTICAVLVGLYLAGSRFRNWTAAETQ